MSRIVAVAAERIHTPLHNPFVTSQGASVSARAVAVTLTLDDDRRGIGESVPVAYVTGETIETVESAVARATAALLDLDTANYRPLLDAISQTLAHEPSA